MYDPGYGPSKSEHAWFVQSFRKIIISKPQTYIRVRAGGRPEQSRICSGLFGLFAEN